LRHALWPHHVISELEEETHRITANGARESVFVAERPGGGLCGMIEMSVREHAKGCRTKNVGYIEGWFVDPDMRNKGVGRKLVCAGVKWARDRGCLEMGSDTTPEYPLSPLAHTRLGFEEVGTTIHFRKDMTEPSAATLPRAPQTGHSDAEH